MPQWKRPGRHERWDFGDTGVCEPIVFHVRLGAELCDQRDRSHSAECAGELGEDSQIGV